VVAAAAVLPAAVPCDVVDVPMYQIDPVLRRASSLQDTREGKGRSVVYLAGGTR
jgi:hypothetical protein